MHRLRRRHESSWGAPVAAQVLESRALLSGAAAAVHQAQAHQAAALHDAAITPQTLKLPAQGSASVNGGLPIPFSGQFTFVKFSETVGTKVTVKFQRVTRTPVASDFLKMSMNGVVSKVVSAAGQTTVTVNPTGGTMLGTTKFPGQHIQKETGTIVPQPFTLVDVNGSFKSVVVAYNFSSTTLPHTGKISFLISVVN